MAKTPGGSKPMMPGASGPGKQTEDELRKSEEWHRTILQVAMDGVWLADTQGHLLEVNAAYCRMSGYTEQELLTMCISDLEAGETTDDIKHHMQQIIAHGEVRFETRHRRKDGTIYDVEVSAQYRSANGGRVVSFLRDITEHKQAKKALIQSELKFRSLFESIGQGFYLAEIIYDTEGIPCDFMYIDVNPAFENMMGLSKEQIIGKTYNEFVPPDPESGWPDCFNRVATTGMPEHYTFYSNVYNKYFEVYAFRPDKEKFCALVKDITEIKRADEKLRESEERFRKIFEETTLGIVTVLPSFIFEKVNPAFCHMLGYTEDELRTMKFTDITHPDYIGHDIEYVKKVRDGELPFYQVEKQYIQKSGKVIWGNIIVSCIRDNQGAFLYFLCMINDITEHIQAEEERAELEARLQQAQKMESIGRLAGGIAHDFNNMLGVILGNAEMALGEAQPEQPLYSELIEIKKAAERSADLTRQLLAFARKQTIAPKVLDLNRTVTGMLIMLNRLIGENVHLNWQPGDDLWPVKMDTTQLDQILVNLCVNARNAIADVGEISILTENIALDAESCAGLIDSTPGEYVLITVRDNGSGMEQELLARIFEPFFTTKSMGAGTGLGLATVYGAVKQNNGFIHVASTPGKGTTFEIYLPRSISKVEQTVSPKSTGQGDGLYCETILLVEDEPALLSLISRILKSKGYTVLTAESPGAAIQLAREHAGEIHLLLTDVIMPEMNGRDLAKNLLSIYPGLKRLFMSGYTADVIAHHGVLEQGVFFIQKPLTKKELLDKIQEVLDHT